MKEGGNCGRVQKEINKVFVKSMKPLLFREGKKKESFFLFSLYFAFSQN